MAVEISKGNSMSVIFLSVQDVKQGIVVALSLPEENVMGIYEKIFDEVEIEDLKKVDGLKTMIAFIYGKLFV